MSLDASDYASIAALRGHVLEHVDGPAHEIVVEVCDRFERLIEAQPLVVAAVVVPAEVHACCAGRAAPARLLAGCAASFVAIRLLDDLMDGDAPILIDARSPGEIQLVSTFFFGAAAELVGLADDELALGGHCRAAYRRMIATMMRGQIEDQLPAGPSSSLEQAATVVERKSGAYLAGLAEMAALAARAPRPMVAEAANLGRHLAIARQHKNDLAGLLTPGSPDLRDRKLTMAVALAISELDHDERPEFVERLNSLRDRPEATDDFIETDLGSVLAPVRSLVEMHRDLARQALRQLERSGRVSRRLRALIDGAGFDDP